MACSTCRRLASLTPARWFSTRLTLPVETPASCATSWMVARVAVRLCLVTPELPSALTASEAVSAYIVCERILEGSGLHVKRHGRSAVCATLRLAATHRKRLHHRSE